MLGHIMEWFYRGLAGISCDPAGPGFKKIILKPQIVGDLGGADVTYDSPYGRIAVKWTRADGIILLDVAIPANTTAMVHVPAKDAAAVTESGQPAGRAAGVKFLRMADAAAVLEVQSGHYQFQSRGAK